MLANATFGTAAIALVALQGGISDFDLQSLENLGDKQLGGDLMFSLVIVIIVHSIVAGSSRTPALSAAEGDAATISPTPS